MSFQQPFSLQNVTTSDDYAAAATLVGPPAQRVRVQIYNASVAFQVEYADGAGWQPEEFQPPWVGTLERPGIAGIRFRSWVAGEPAQVSAVLLPGAGLDAGVVPAITVDTAGKVKPAVTGAARLRAGGNQAIPNGVETVISFDTVEFDTNGMTDLTNHPTRITAQVAGIYLIEGLVAFVTAAGGSQRAVTLRLNGDDAKRVDLPAVPPSSGQSTNVSGAGVWQCVVGDYVELLATQDSGGSIDSVATSPFAPHLSMAILPG